MYTCINILRNAVLCVATICDAKPRTQHLLSNLTMHVKKRKSEGGGGGDIAALRVHVSHGFRQQLFDNIGTNLKLVSPINNENMMLMFTLNLQVRVVSENELCGIIGMGEMG